MHSMATLQPSVEGRSSSISRASITAEGEMVSLINCSLIAGTETTAYKEWGEHNAFYGYTTTQCRGAVL